MEKVVHIFRSFEEAQASDDRRRREMTPEERVEVFLALQRRAHTEAADAILPSILRCLATGEVEFLIVGALAVSWHGFPRFSGDIDFFVNPDRTNAERVIAALKQFGFGGVGITEDDLTTEDRIIQLGVEPNRIDLMTSISAVTFEEAWQSRVHGTLDGMPVNFIGRAALIKNKRASGRSKDLIDIEELTRQDPSQ